MTQTNIKSKSELESILDYKNNSYTGNRVNQQIDIDFSDKKITFDSNTWNQGLTQLFLELIANSIDNFTRAENKEYYLPQTYINVEINQDIITVSNDGVVIPVLQEGEDISSAFGKLRTSGNYVSNSNTIGLYGIGGKVVNIFSKEYTVQIEDSYNKKMFIQTWYNHMQNTDKPTIKKYNNKSSTTTVSYLVDFSLFYKDENITPLTEYNYGDIQVIRFHCLNTAMLTGLKVNFKCNYKNINFDDTYKGLSFEKYILYFNFDNSIRFNIEKNDIFFIQNLTQQKRFISFVNGIYTLNGGKHVDYWYNQIFNTYKTKLKATKFKKQDFEKNVIIVLNYTCTNPKFTDHIKTSLTGPSPSLKEKDIPTFNKIVKKLVEWIPVDEKPTKAKKLEKSYEKINIKRHEAIINWPNNQGTLHICEGDSASTFVRWGIIYDGGRNNHGIFIGRGKILNTSKASDEQIKNNNIISELTTVLNIIPNVDYTIAKNLNTLAYKRILFSFDADSDGNHILSLYINHLANINISLLKIKDFIGLNSTPLISIKTSGKSNWFYSNSEFENYITKNPNYKGELVRYKGLGRFEKKDAYEIFGKKILNIVYTKTSDDILDLTFGKIDKMVSYKIGNNQLNDRKDMANYYLNYIYNKRDIDYKKNTVTIDDIMLILVGEYQLEDNIRSIPSVIDGFKEAQRKIFYTILNTKFKDNIKVADLAARITSKANYHHGEVSAAETIIKMAQTYTGSNNIALLEPKGIFGTITDLGNDSANARYIFTAINEITHFIFRKEDNIILVNQISEGQKIEPIYYPIIPMILVNGSSGIGFGYCTKIPLYNPIVLIEYIIKWLDNKNIEFNHLPYYKGFNGQIKLEDDQVISYGRFDCKTNTIKELPVNSNYRKYEEYLKIISGYTMDNKKKSDKQFLESYKPFMLDNGIIEFTVKPLDTDQFKLIEKLKLSKVIQRHLVAFDTNGIIREYADETELLDEWCNFRYKKYIERKDKYFNQLNEEFILKNDISAFILAVIKGNFELKNRNKQDFINFFVKEKYSENSYDQLFDIKTINFTKEKIAKIQEELNNLQMKIEEYKNISINDLWKRELYELLEKLK